MQCLWTNAMLVYKTVRFLPPHSHLYPSLPSVLWMELYFEHSGNILLDLTIYFVLNSFSSTFIGTVFGAFPFFNLENIFYTWCHKFMDLRAFGKVHKGFICVSVVLLHFYFFFIFAYILPFKFDPLSNKDCLVILQNFLPAVTKKWRQVCAL